MTQNLKWLTLERTRISAQSSHLIDPSGLRGLFEAIWLASEMRTLVSTLISGPPHTCLRILRPFELLVSLAFCRELWGGDFCHYLAV